MLIDDDIETWAKIGPIQIGFHHRYPVERGGTKDSFPYLGNEHVHMLFVTVWVQQKHDDRDIEYLAAHNRIQHLLIGLLGGTSYNTGQVQSTWSCEMIARNLLKTLAKDSMFEFRNMEIEVLEDGRNGAVSRVKKK